MPDFFFTKNKLRIKLYKTLDKLYNQCYNNNKGGRESEEECIQSGSCGRCY